MKKRVGEQFNGTITGVVPFGLFITLENLFVEGLLHVSELGVEYFQHNEITHELRGERTGKRHKLYDKIQVQLLRVDMDGRRIEFSLAPKLFRKPRSKKTGVDIDVQETTSVSDGAFSRKHKVLKKASSKKASSKKASSKKASSKKASSKKSNLKKMSFKNK